MKYQRIAQFSIGLHTIHVQAWHDPENRWLSTPYKLSDEELEAIVDDWTVTWREPVSLEEVLMGPPVDAP